MSESSRKGLHLRYLFGGLLTLVPLAITVFAVQLVFSILSRFGAPWIRALVRQLEPYYPGLAGMLDGTWIASILAFLLSLLMLYLLGWGTSKVIGRRVLKLVNAIINRVPVVQTIYSATQRVVDVLQQKPRDVERIVLVEFPHKGMKAVGMATRTFEDADTGETLVAVYVPTTPNPTSGYLEIVPLDQVTPTDWSVDDAMTFVISAGAVAPPKIQYHRQARMRLDGQVEEVAPEVS